MPDNQQTFFADAVSEKLFESLVALAAEVHVLRDRVTRLEASATGQPAKTPDTAASAEAFVQHVFGGLARL
ncbi:MAG: hypothetical protein AB7F09_07030 [Parvibaculaceae bacterium]